MTMRQVAVYVFRIRTNVVLVVASVIGYYFFSGVRTFAVVFSRQQYGLGQAQAALLFPVLGVGAVIGVLVSGRGSDRLAARVYRSARIVAVLVAYFGAVAFLAPALLTGSLAVGLPLLVAAAGLLSVVNPPLDAARIDIMPTALLGRAESVRSLLRNVGDATAPVVFGVLGAHIGLQRTFLVMLLPMLLGRPARPAGPAQLSRRRRRRAGQRPPDGRAVAPDRPSYGGRGGAVHSAGVGPGLTHTVDAVA